MGSYAVDFTIDVAGPKQLPELLLEEGGQHAEGGVDDASKADTWS